MKEIQSNKRQYKSIGDKIRKRIKQFGYRQPKYDLNIDFDPHSQTFDENQSRSRESIENKPSNFRENVGKCFQKIWQKIACSNKELLAQVQQLKNQNKLLQNQKINAQAVLEHEQKEKYKFQDQLTKMKEQLQIAKKQNTKLDQECKRLTKVQQYFIYQMKQMDFQNELLKKNNHIAQKKIVQLTKGLEENKANFVKLEAQLAKTNKINWENESKVQQLIKKMNDKQKEQEQIVKECMKNIEKNNELSQKISKFEKKQKKIVDENIGKCKYCLDKAATQVNITCGHVNLCDDCVKIGINKNTCIFCRQPGKYIPIYASLICEDF